MQTIHTWKPSQNVRLPDSLVKNAFFGNPVSVNVLQRVEGIWNPSQTTEMFIHPMIIKADLQGTHAECFAAEKWLNVIFDVLMLIMNWNESLSSMSASYLW